MKRITLLVIFLLALNKNCNSQEIKLAFQTGIGMYSMDGLKNLNYELLSNLPFDTEIVSDFPPYLYYRPSVIVNFNNLGFGLIYTFQSTGSRVSAKDYSGEYRYDMRVNSNNPGIYGELRIADEKIYKISLYSIFGLAFSKLETQYYLSLFDTEQSNEIRTFKALNYFLEPGINFTHPIKSLSICVNLAYMIQFGKEAFYEGSDKENILYDYDNQVSVKPNWNGLRAGLTIAYSFKITSKN